MLRVMSSSKQLGITGENSVVGSDSSIVSVNVTAGNLKCNSQNYNKGLGEEPTSSLALASAATSLSGSSSRGGGLSNGICRGTTTATTTASTAHAHAHSHSYSCAGDYVTISASHSGVPTATATATPTKSFAPVSSPPPVAAAVGTEGGTDATAVPQPGRYNGIFLVDGLGHGVRIERQIQMESSPSVGGVYEYGLPIESGFQMRERQYFPGYVGGQEIPNPVCIRIDGTTTAAAVGSEIGLDANVAKFSGHGSYFQGECPAGGAIIPVVPGSSSYVGKAMNRNSVTLPVPSPPPHGNGNIGVELNGGGGIGIPGINPKSQSSGSLTMTTTERTLISTEAQTEDLPTTTTAMAALPPPPPPSRNREQRKRERRERRRADRNLNQNPNYHFSGQSTGSRPGAVGPGPSRNGCQTSTNTENNNVIYANATTISGDEHQQQQSRNGNSHGFCENGQFPGQSQGQGQLGLPDLLNSHLPPPYSTLPQTCERRVGLGFSGNVPLHGAGMNHLHPPMQIQGLPIQGFVPPMLPPPQPMLGLGSGPPQAVCLASPPQPVRYHFAPTTRASRRSLRTPRGVPYASEEEPKSCCGMSTSQAVSIRWFIIVIAVIGICCTVAGTALGAARSAGSQHLTLSLLMIGVGVVLLTVSAVAWRLTANESGTSCRAMLGFARNGSSRGDGGAEPNRRFVPRLAPSYGRPHHPYAAMMYPDFQYRPPPPSYQASMQEYRLRLLLLERSNPTIAAAAGLTNPISSSMVPPPPAYRPYTGHHRPGGLRHDADFTRPPSYRSRSSGGYDNSPGSRPSMVPGLDHPHQSHMMDSPIHSRDPSILSYLSQQSMADNVSVVSGAGNRGQGNSNSAVVTVMQAVSVGMDLGMMSPMTYDPAVRDGPEAGDSKELPESNEDEGLVVVGGIKGGGLHCEKSRSKDGNLVRIVQTTDSSQVIGRNSSSVIVTVSGSNHSLWDQSLQNAVNNNTNSTNGSNHSHVGSPGTENNEVQILAHL